MIKEFREFLLRGTVVDLAVAVVIGAAFGAVIGSFINTVVSFVIIAGAVFFLVVKPVNTVMARRKAGDTPEPVAPSEDVVLLGEIRDLLKAGR